MNYLDLFIKNFDKITSTNTQFKDVTTMGVGGKIAAFVKIENKTMLIDVMEYITAHNIDFFVLGNGSNVVCSDYGYNGVVIKLCGEFDDVEIQDEKAVVGASCGLGKLLKTLAENNLTGLEFLYGIPASVGGAVAMNAGAFGGEIGEHIEWIEYFENGKINKIFNKNCNFSYRSSIFLQKKCIITSISLKLNRGRCDEITCKMKNFLEWRKQRQPYSYRSAGSVFKRMNDFLPAKIIDELGLKGKTIGDAQVSKIHSGFIVNLGQATCQDILNLISYIKQVVYNSTRRELELEIIVVGEKS